jgi:hypothetical protein
MQSGDHHLRFIFLFMIQFFGKSTTMQVMQLLGYSYSDDLDLFDTSVFGATVYSFTSYCIQWMKYGRHDETRAMTLAASSFRVFNGASTLADQP